LVSVWYLTAGPFHTFYYRTFYYLHIHMYAYAHVNPARGSPIVAITLPLMALHNVICSPFPSSSRILMKKRQVFHATVMEASNEHVWKGQSNCVYKSWLNHLSWIFHTFWVISILSNVIYELLVQKILYLHCILLIIIMYLILMNVICETFYIYNYTIVLYVIYNTIVWFYLFL